MEAEALRRANDLARFMQLSNEARMRNSGLSNGTGSRRPDGVMPAAQRPFAEARKGEALPQQAMDSRTYATAPQPSAGMKIVGGRFDAYA